MILHNRLGVSSAGEVFDATLEWDDCLVQIAAKFYTANTKSMKWYRSNENDTRGSHPPLPNPEKEFAFTNEIAAYTHLTNTSMFPQFYGAFQGVGSSGYQTGLVLVEKLPVTFEEPSGMTEAEKLAAYQNVVEVHNRGVHHEDVWARNFGKRDDGSVVIYDFSHSALFKECDIETCDELRWAKRTFLEQEGWESEDV